MVEELDVQGVLGLQAAQHVPGQVQSVRVPLDVGARGPHVALPHDLREGVHLALLAADRTAFFSRSRVCLGGGKAVGQSDACVSGKGVSGEK